jgi:ABC-type glycerol-3-phosphate transport system permease component
MAMTSTTPLRAGRAGSPGKGGLGRVSPAQVVIWVLLAALVMLNLFPFFWVVLSSFKPGSEINTQHPKLLPHRWTLANYRNMAYNMGDFGRFYLNSFLVTIGTVGLTLLVGSLAAYGFARFRFPGSSALFYMLVFSMFLPGELALIGRFELFQQFRLLNKISGLTVAYTASGLAMVLFIMRNVFRGIPQEMIDAARIDGCGTWSIFWEIMVPMGKTGLVAAGVLTSMGAWNEFLFAVTTTWSTKAQTLPVGIMLLRGQFEHWDYGMLFATLMLSFLPVMILFIVLQKQFIRGATAGAIKG